MTFGVWVVIFYVLGALYMIDWYRAQKVCKKGDLWLMFTPLWCFYPDSFESDVKRLCNRVKIYYLVAAGLFCLWVFGFIEN